MWTTWCDLQGIPTFLYPDDLHRSQNTVLDFLIDSRDIRGNKESTLRGKASALALQFKYLGHEDPTKFFMIKQFFKGVSKADAGTPEARKLPVGRRHLLNAKTRLDLYASWGSACWAALHLGYFFMLRSNNYTAPGGNKAFEPARILMRQDVTFLIDESATELTPDTAPFISSVHLFIKSTKTDQRGAGYARTLHRTNDPDLCVVRALVRHFMNTAGAPDDWPVTAYYTEQGRNRRAQGVVTRKDVADLLKVAGTALGEPADGLGSHSLRIGGATALHSTGTQDSAIMWFGNWSSPTYLIYCRASKDLSDHFATTMARADVVVHREDLDDQALRRARPLYGGR
jgi:hypothetical protein